MLKAWKESKLWVRILIALGTGLLLGLYLNWAGHSELLGFVKPVGDIFINAIKMVMLPLIFVSLVSGVTSMHDPEKMSRVGLKTIVLYLATTAFAVLLGLLVTNIIEPGAGAVLPAAEDITAGRFSLRERLITLIPTNPIAAFAKGDVLQVIVFSLFIGISINLAGPKGTTIKDFFDSASEVMYKFVHLIMEYAPYGVLALMTYVVGTQGPDVISNLALIIVTLYVACLLHIILVYGGLVTFGARLNPKQFFKGIVDAQSVAYSTATSAGTLPVTLANVQDNLGVSKSVSSFVLPLGATMNMDGTAIYMGIAAVFTAQAMGVDLTFVDYTTVILTGVLASIGAASVPSAGLIIMPLVLSSIGLPLGAIALFVGVDRIMDMMRTMTNVTGDAMVSVLVSKSEGELDLEVFNAEPVE